VVKQMQQQLDVVHLWCVLGQMWCQSLVLLAEQYLNTAAPLTVQTAMGQRKSQAAALGIQQERQQAVKQHATGLQQVQQQLAAALLLLGWFLVLQQPAVAQEQQQQQMLGMPMAVPALKQWRAVPGAAPAALQQGQCSSSSSSSSSSLAKGPAAHHSISSSSSRRVVRQRSPPAASPLASLLLLSSAVWEPACGAALQGEAGPQPVATAARHRAASRSQAASMQHQLQVLAAALQ
jgi:hypothetical protein